ncbi:MAG: endonuclease/exonuclease/phosphatase family protein [Alphaproteobacteria bacterium]|nr:endonuclease/exonuclease/phosphatase family protein [Alphaproteobacteria bacterium]
MKIVSWNCCGKFREKHKIIKELNADIYIIQECENPELTNNKEYIDFSQNFIWYGDNKNKGLGVFAKKQINLKNNNWEPYCLRHFISINVNNDFNLLAVWACVRYIEEYYVYQSIHKDKYDKNMCIIGDFNSNSQWDNKHHKRDHSSVVKELEDMGLVSAYHYIYEQKQGNETNNTFYLYRHLDKGYHIDYAFIDKNRIKSFKILNSEEWLIYSDHKPIILEII